MKCKVLWIAGLMLAATAGQAEAAAVFSFSFTNFGGNVPGTVTGKIYGLNDNSTGAASLVTIETFPSGLNSVFPSGPIDATSWDRQFENSFTVLAGQITGGGFFARETMNFGAQLYINGTTFGFNYVNLDGANNLYVQGRRGFAAANFAPVSSDVPEPASLAMWGISAVGMMFARRKRQQMKLAA